jgi:RNA polymerase sigma factor (sigma-70 family)
VSESDHRDVATDAELIGWSLAGDHEAFAEVACRHQQAVWAYLVRRAGRGSAEDLLGEVWVTAFESRRRYDRSFPDARPWLYGIALNVLRHYWRVQPREVLAADVACGESDPWPAVDDRINTAAVTDAAIQRLRAEHAEVLRLVVWEQLSIAGAARVLGIPTGTAHYYLHQARLALRDMPSVRALLTELNKAKEAQ